MKRSRILGCWVAASSALPLSVMACSGHEVPKEGVEPSLASLYPAAAEWLEATGPNPSVDGSELVVRTQSADVPATSGKWAATGRALEMRIAGDDARSRIVTSPRGKFAVHRIDGTATPATLVNDHVVARGASGVDTVFVPHTEGVEELVQLSETTRSIQYELGLPQGWQLRKAKSAPAVVEVVDERRIARFRVRADKAWDTAGNELDLEITHTPSTLSVTVMEAAEGRVLVDPIWQDAGEVTKVRRQPTTTLLSSGRILVAGGAGTKGGDATPLTELFDPATLTFTVGAGLSVARIDHYAVQLATGEVLFAGGFDHDVDDFEGASARAAALATAELYDPVTDAMTPIANLTQARARGTATVLHDGRVLFAGGTSGGTTLSSAEIYDPATKTFTATLPMPVARQEHAAVVLSNGHVLLIGGTDGSGAQALASTTIFNGTSWVAGPNLLTPRFGHVAVVLPDQRVFVAGGKDPAIINDQLDVLDTIETLDASSPGSLPASFTIEPVGPECAEPPGLREERFRSAAALLPNGKVMIAGGLHSEAGIAIELSTKEVEMFDPDQNCSQAIEPSVFQTHSPSLVVMPNGKALLTGRSPSAQIFDVTSLVPSSVVPYEQPEPMNQMTTTLLSTGEVLVAGGQNSSGVIGSAYLFNANVNCTGATTADPCEGAFTEITGLAQPRTLHSATRLLDGTVLIAAGASNGTVPDVYASAELYHPNTQTFETVGSLAQARFDHSATLLPDGRVVIAGGLLSLEESTASVEIYDPETKTFSAGPSLGKGREDHAATLLITGDILISGGTDKWDGNELFVDAEILDIDGGTSTPTPNMKEGRRTHRSVPLPDGRILLTGGAPTTSSEVYDPASGTFSFVGSTPEGRFLSDTVTLPSGNVVFVGGKTGNGSAELRTVAIFDPVTETWDNAKDLSTPEANDLLLADTREYGTATILPDGSLLVLGGYRFTTPPPDFLPTFTESVLAERFQPVPAAPLASAQPKLDSGPAKPIPGQIAQGADAIKGSSLLGFGEVGSGTYASNSRFPVALWLSEGGAFELGTFVAWTDNSADWLVPAPRYPGPGLLFAVANGIVSNGLSAALPPADLGVGCVTDSQCATGFCSDGVCCDARCDGPCEACSAAVKGSEGAGPDGTCEPVAAMFDPKDACPVFSACAETPTGFCDGAGQCAACPAPVECDGDHTLVGDDFTEDCSPFKCSTETNQCLNTCGQVADCVSGGVCDASGQCVGFPVDDNESSCAASPARQGARAWAVGALLALGMAGWAARRRRAAAR